MIEVEEIPPHVDRDDVERRAREPNHRENCERTVEQIMEAYGIEEPWSSRELDEADVSSEFLVENVLVAGQPAELAGASKTMKTSIGIDLALSLAGPSRFLGQFWVPAAKRVLFLSAESGEATIQETARRIAASKDGSLSTENRIAWGFWVPRAKNSEQLLVLEHQLDKYEAEVAIIDPLYQVLDGEDQANLSMNGEQLKAVCKRCLDRKITPILIDHVKRSSANAQNHQPLELTDVTGAGKAEFFRQWILVSRREKFNPEEPIHRLWMSIGGSAGHCGLWSVDIDETRDPETQARSWEASVDTASNAVDEAEERKNALKQEQAKKKAGRHAQQMRDAFIGTGTNGLTKTSARNRAGLNAKDGEQAIGKLLREGILEKTKVKNGGGEYDGFRLVDCRVADEDER